MIHKTQVIKIIVTNKFYKRQDQTPGRFIDIMRYIQNYNKFYKKNPKLGRTSYTDTRNNNLSAKITLPASLRVSEPVN